MSFQEPSAARLSRFFIRYWLFAVCFSFAAISLWGQSSVSRETYGLLGWKGCAAAVAQYGYPRLGEGIVGDPVTARVGVLTPDLSRRQDKASWTLKWDGGLWDKDLGLKAEQALKKEGYVFSGYEEEVDPERVSSGLSEAKELLSPDDLFPPGFKDRPSAEWALSRVYYSTSGTCGLMVFKNGPVFAGVLSRLADPAARFERARDHVANAMLLLKNEKPEQALAESATAAGMAPQMALARYEHAALLCFNGQIEAAMDELVAATILNPYFKKKARQDENFSLIAAYPRFKKITEPGP